MIPCDIEGCALPSVMPLALIFDEVLDKVLLLCQAHRPLDRATVLVSERPS